MKFVRLVVTAGLALGLANGAAAVSFTFTGLGSVPGGGYVDTQGGITVTVTAPGEALGYLTLDGIGVYTGGLNLDGIQNGETLLISFSEAVTVGDLHMRQWEDADEIDISADTGGFLSYGPDAGGAFNTNEFIDLSSFGALNSLTITGDSLFTVTLLAGLVDVEAVPEPHTALLLGLALIGLARQGSKRGRA